MSVWSCWQRGPRAVPTACTEVWERLQEALQLGGLAGRQVEVVGEESAVGQDAVAEADAGEARAATPAAMVRQDRQGEGAEQQGERENLGLHGHDASPQKRRGLLVTHRLEPRHSIGYAGSSHSHRGLAILCGGATGGPSQPTHCKLKAPCNRGRPSVPWWDR